MTKGYYYWMRTLRDYCSNNRTALRRIQKTAAQFYFYDNNFYDTPVMFEFGGSVGIMNCLSDVGGLRGNGRPFLKDLTIGNNQVNGSIYLSMLYKYAVGFRLEGTFGHVKAYDSISLKSVSEGTLRT
jgi:hypothetical protein